MKKNIFFTTCCFLLITLTVQVSVFSGLTNEIHNLNRDYARVNRQLMNQESRNVELKARKAIEVNIISVSKVSNQYFNGGFTKASQVHEVESVMG